MPRRSSTLWLGACAAAALMLVTIVVLLARARASKQVRAAAPPIASTPPCAVPTPTLRRADPTAEAPPVILYAVGGARIFIDGRAAFSPPETPEHFSPGEHELRVEAPGHEAITSRVRFLPFKPALIHAEVDDALGLSVVRLGIVCQSCEPSITPMSSFPPTKRGTAPAQLLAEAASLLRRDRWEEAATRLGAWPPKAKRSAAYHRLAAATWMSAGDAVRARQEAGRIRHKDARDLDVLLRRLDGLEHEERERYARVVMARWNKLTEQHSAILRTAHGTEALELGASEQRIEALSAAFNVAMQQKSVPEEERIFESAEASTKALLQRLIDARRDDCVFRTRLATALAGESP